MVKLTVRQVKARSYYHHYYNRQVKLLTELTAYGERKGREKAGHGKKGNATHNFVLCKLTTLAIIRNIMQDTKFKKFEINVERKKKIRHSVENST